MQFLLPLFVLGGLLLATIFHFNGVQNQQWYLLTVALLLAMGLYSSTFGISIKDARQHIRLILKAITVGVLVKAFIVGAALSLALHHPFGFVLGIIVAQIDPLATAALLKDTRLSKQAQAVLRSWSSFDDPMTVILSLYTPVLIATFTGSHWQAIRGSMQEGGLGGYFVETGINILFAAGIFILWRLMKRHSRASHYGVLVLVALGMYGLLIGALSVAVYYFWMLGIALLGLFMRPPIEKIIDGLLHWALSLAAILLGILLTNGINLWPGILLGVVAYGAQVIVGFALTRHMPQKDRLHIAFAQQNGITAIILALLFETYYPGTVAIVGPAILVTNILYFGFNAVLDARLEGRKQQFSPQFYLKRLKAHLGKM